MRTALASMLILLLGAGIAAADLMVTEIMYNSPGEDVEYFELYNYSETSLDLAGWTVVDDLDHDFIPLVGVLDPGGVIVVVQYMDVFMAQYPDVTNINPYTFNDLWGLGNSSDHLRVFNELGEQVDYVAYQDGGDWPEECDGDGPSLELIDPDLDNELPASWAASAEDWGTPGTVDFTPVAADGMSFSALKALY